MAIAKIISRKVTQRNRNNEPSFYHIQMSDGISTWNASMTPESLRRQEILIQLEEAGTNMELVSELEDFAFTRGQESMEEED
jgi:hypothetical protein